MPTPHTPPIAIIGSGLAGLAAACTLAARHYPVILFERNPWLGGKAATLDEAGFHFDMGPTILLMPSVLRRIFKEANQRLEDHLDLIELDPQWRCFYDDGSVLDLKKSPTDMAASLSAFSPDTNASAGYKNFMDKSARLRDISEQFFFHKSVGGIRDTFDIKGSFNIKVLQDLLAMRMGSSVASTVRHYVKDARIAQMIDHFTQYVGSSPDQSPAVLCGIARMQTDEGLWYPRGGTGAVPRALAKLAVDLGVDIRTNTKIIRIDQQMDSGKPRVTAVHTDQGETIPVSAVVSNSDTVRTHRELLPTRIEQKFQSRRRYEPACSGVVLYLGLKKRYPHLLHHNFVFSKNPHDEFHAIYTQGEPAQDLTAYLAAPAATEPSVAPPGGEALYVLVHTPYLRPHHDWSKMLPPYRNAIIKKLQTTGGMPDIEDRIVLERFLTPQDINDRYHVLNGAIYGLASHGKFTGAFKPANRSPDVRGLYLAGGSAHPGPGMPMVLMSGWIAADTLDQDALASRNLEPVQAV